MNRLSLTAVAGGLVVLASCSQEEVSTVVQNKDGLPISFRAGVSTRVNPDLNYIQNPATFYVSAYAPNHMSDTGVIPDSLFWDEPFYLMGANLYASSSNQKWPSREQADKVEFFAYAPSLEEIQNAAFTQLDQNDPNYSNNLTSYRNAIQFFNLCNDNVPLDPMGQMSTTFKDVQLYKGFKLGRFYVATDISKQVDFITSHISVDVPENEDQAKLGAELKFKHQLSNIELRAFGANDMYNIEIAGVRIGRPYTGNAIFNFCDGQGGVDFEAGGQWGISKNPQRLPVEYIYGAGDETYRIGKFNNLNGGATTSTTPHSTAAKAESIMGKGGNAMVLPTKNGAWAGEANPWIAPKYSAYTGSGEDPYPNQDPDPWSADNEYGDMYFSILLRVTLKPGADELVTPQIYPYGNNTTMNVVYLEMEKNSNKIVRRVENKNVIPGPNNEIVEFGWAAVPVGVNWERGKKYVYTLDFSNGVGIQDPEDPKPGTPIIGDGIKFSVSIEGWNEQPNNTHVPTE
ncbi:MAG: fimbrillin family protein [Muribaculaceae bacterium]|nr:fimbrillin family protein [Muribaculaceae bacterium]MDE6552005.1 fimbrillin family protein [Muribaculaceae bacterium]